MTKNSIVARISIITGLALGAFALSAMAGTWTSAPPSPPNNNVDAPINVGGTPQGKTGILSLANFLFNPTSQANIAVGSVLTAQDTSGTVGWSTAGLSTCNNLLLAAPRSSILYFNSFSTPLQVTVAYGNGAAFGFTLYGYVSSSKTNIASAGNIVASATNIDPLDQVAKGLGTYTITFSVPTNKYFEVVNTGTPAFSSGSITCQ